MNKNNKKFKLIVEILKYVRVVYSYNLFPSKISKTYYNIL